MDNSEEFLDYIPLRKCEHKITDGIVTVLFFRPLNSFMDKLFFRGIAKKPSKIDLDEIGSYIWLCIDGKKSVGKIIQEAEDKFNEKIEPAEERVIMFIRKMAGTKLIDLYKKR